MRNAPEIEYLRLENPFVALVFQTKMRLIFLLLATYGSADGRYRIASFVARLSALVSVTPRTAPASALVSFAAAFPART